MTEALASNTTLNQTGFIKLLSLGLFEALLTLPIGVISLVQNLLQRKPTDFWPGWKVAHAHFSIIPTVRSEEWKTAGIWTVITVRLDQCVNLVFAVAFFLLFGLTEQKRSCYRSLFCYVMKPFGFKPRADPQAHASDIVFGSRPFPNSRGSNARETAS